MDAFEMACAERQLLADRLAGLPDEAWSGPTLCQGWSVGDVVAHLVAIGSMSTLAFFSGMRHNRFNFATFQAEGIKKRSEGKSPAELLADFRATVSSKAKPPGPRTTVLGEVIVHGEDIFRVVEQGFSEHAAEHVVKVADFYKRNRFPLRVKRRIAGVTLRMTDADWSYGSGPEAAGPGVAVLMAMVGREVALSDLKGNGVALLASRSGNDAS